MKKNKYLKKIILICIVMIYIYRVYNINQDTPDLRNYTEEQIGIEFKAFDGNLEVEKIDKVSLDNKDKLSANNKRYISSNEDEYISVVYKTINMKSQENMEIKLNLDGYIFYDGLPSSEKIGENTYEYLIPIPNEKLESLQKKDLNVFFDNIKYDELEHHYIKIK